MAEVLQQSVQEDSQFLIDEKPDQQYLSGITDEFRVQQHPFQILLDKAKRSTKDIYVKSGLNNDFLEKKAQALDDLSEPYLIRLTQFLDKKVDQAYLKYNNVRGQLNNQKMQLIQKGKTFPLVQQAEILPEKILNHLEEQVNHLSTLVQINQQQSQLMNEESDLQADKQTKILQRSQRLISQVNLLTKLVFSKYSNELIQFAGLRIIQDQIQKAKISDKVLEVRIFTSILSDVVQEQLNSKIINPIKNQTQTVTNQTINIFNQGKTAFFLQYTNSKQNIAQIIPLIQNKYTILQQSVVQFATTGIQFQFCQQFYQQNQQKILNALNSLYLDIKNHSETYQRNAIELYEKTVQNYLQKRNNKKISLLQVSDKKSE